jgi:hypothetical protein
MSRGGARKGAGRPSKADEEKANATFLNALKTVYSAATDEQAKELFVIGLLQEMRGKIFVAEHVFGKPKEYVQTEDVTAKVMTLTLEEIDELKIEL